MGCMDQEIIKCLAPMLGDTTARNLLTHYCAKLKIKAEEITAAHLPELSRAIKPMLAVWLGSAGAAQLAEQVARLGRVSVGK